MIRNLSILTNFSNNESFSDNCRDKFCNLSFKLESSSSFLLSTCGEPVINKHKSMKINKLLSCQPRVTVTSCNVYKIIRDLESIDHLCINPNPRVGLIHK